jgi:hypothetical protein
MEEEKKKKIPFFLVYESRHMRSERGREKERENEKREMEMNKTENKK